MQGLPSACSKLEEEKVKRFSTFVAESLVHKLQFLATPPSPILLQPKLNLDTHEHGLQLTHATDIQGT